jgi:hypothetical protein
MNTIKYNKVAILTLLVSTTWGAGGQGTLINELRDHSGKRLAGNISDSEVALRLGERRAITDGIAVVVEKVPVFTSQATNPDIDQGAQIPEQTSGTEEREGVTVLHGSAPEAAASIADFAYVRVTDPQDPWKLLPTKPNGRPILLSPKSVKKSNMLTPIVEGESCPETVEPSTAAPDTPDTGGASSSSGPNSPTARFLDGLNPLRRQLSYGNVETGQCVRGLPFWAPVTPKGLSRPLGEMLEPWFCNEDRRPLEEEPLVLPMYHFTSAFLPFYEDQGPDSFNVPRTAEVFNINNELQVPSVTIPPNMGTAEHFFIGDEPEVVRDFYPDVLVLPLPGSIFGHMGRPDEFPH